MAGANLPAKKYKKTAPTTLRLSFEGSGNTTRFIDIARALSIINRKFYRQGVYYYVNSVELYNNEDAYVDLFTLPDNWVTKNAHQRGFAMFQQMNRQVDTPRPKYNDFKVLMSTLQSSDGSNTMDPDLYDEEHNNTNMPPDEWDYSKFVTLKSDGGDADEFFVTMLGDHVGAEGNRVKVGLIKSYQDSRAIPDASGEPVTTSGHASDPLNNLFDASGDHALEDIIGNLQDDNDQTPYNADSYVGNSDGHLHHVARLATSAITGRVAKASGFCVPFGLICVGPQSTASDYTLVLNLAAGTYHGVYAERA